jgi:hypothetical protein
MKKTEQQKTVVICQSYSDTTDSIPVDNEDLFSSIGMHLFARDTVMSSDYAICNSFYFGDNKRLAALQMCHDAESMKPHLTAPLIIRMRFSNMRQTDRAIYSILRSMTILKQDYMTKVVSCALDELEIEHNAALNRYRDKIVKNGVCDIYQAIDNMFTDVAKQPNKDIDSIINAIELVYSNNDSWNLIEGILFIRAIQAFMPYVSAYFNKGSFTSSEIVLLLLYSRGCAIVRSKDTKSSFICSSLSQFASTKLVCTSSDQDVSAWIKLRDMIEQNPLVASTCLLTVLSMAHAMHVYRFGLEPSSVEIMFYFSKFVENKWAAPRASNKAKLMGGQLRVIVPCNHKDLRDFAATVHMNMNDGRDRKNTTRICTSFSGMPLGTLRDDDVEVLQMIETLLVRFVRVSWGNKDKVVQTKILSEYPALKSQTAYEVSNWLTYELCYVRNMYPEFPDFMEFRHVPELRNIVLRWQKIGALLEVLLEYQEKSLRQFRADLDNGLNNIAPPIQKPPIKPSKRAKEQAKKKKNKRKAVVHVIKRNSSSVDNNEIVSVDKSEENKETDRGDIEEDEESEEDEEDDEEEDIIDSEDKSVLSGELLIPSAPPVEFCGICHKECYFDHLTCPTNDTKELEVTLDLEMKMIDMFRSILPED